MGLTKKQIDFILSEFRAKYLEKFDTVPSGGFWIVLPVDPDTDADGYVKFSFNVMSRKGIRATGSYSPECCGCDAELSLSI